MRGILRLEAALAIKHLEAAREATEQAGDRWQLAVAEAHLAHTLFETDRLDEAMELWTNARTTFATSGDDLSEGCASSMIAFVHQQLGDVDAATVLFEKAVEAYATGDDVRSQAHTLQRLGAHHAASGDHASAQRSWLSAADLLNDVHEPDAAEFRSRLLDQIEETS